MITAWLVMLDALAGDIAFVGVMLAWARRRNRARLLSNWDTATSTPVIDDVLGRLAGADKATAGELRQARFITNLAKRVVNTQAFHYLVLAARHKDGYLYREGASFFRMLRSRDGESVPTKRTALGGF